MKKRVILHSEKKLLDDYFQVDEAWLSYEKFDGSMSRLIRRLNFLRPDAAACLLYRSSDSSILLVNQFRYPAFTKHKGWLYEIPAGIVEPREKPQETVCREVFEETGYAIANPEFLFYFFTSPGISSERCYLFSMPIEEDLKKEEGGGCSQENEDIKTEWVSIEKIESMIQNQEIVDAKTILSIQWFLLNRSFRRT